MNEISCNTSAWPILKMHFPSHPTDVMVVTWLEKLDSLLKLEKKWVVISTFADNYQFSASARRHQAVWFKRNKTQLQQLCLGMVRVTQDPLMIAKLLRPAMRQGMPFSCIPVSTLIEAEAVARKLISL